MKKFIFVIYLFLITNLYSTGETSFNFLKNDIDSRADGLGGAFISIKDNTSSIRYNPAGIIGENISKKNAANLTYYQGVGDLIYNSLIYTRKFKKITAGINLVYIYLSEFNNNESQSSVNYNNYLINFSMAYPIPLKKFIIPRIVTGIAINYIKSYLLDYKTTAFLFDVGMIMESVFFRDFNIGCSLKNIGAKVKYNITESDIPTYLAIGGNYNLKIGINNFLICSDYIINFHSENILKIGGELIFNKLVALRIGYKINKYTNIFCTGIGVLIFTFPTKVNLDYSYENNFIEKTYSISCSVKF